MLLIKDLKYNSSGHRHAAVAHTTSGLLERRFPDYVRRLLDFRQMDFEAAFDQIVTLFSTEPQQMSVRRDVLALTCCLDSKCVIIFN